jgi:hypothetical protein
MPRAFGSNRALRITSSRAASKGFLGARVKQGGCPTVNSIRLARNRESGDACSHGRNAQTDLVGSHRAVPIKSFARSGDPITPTSPRASITLRRCIALRAAIPTPSRSKNARWRSLRRRSGGLLVALSLANLARNYQARGLLEDALEASRRAVTIRVARIELGGCPLSLLAAIATPAALTDRARPHASTRRFVCPCKAKLDVRSLMARHGDDCVDF